MSWLTSRNHAYFWTRMLKNVESFKYFDILGKEILYLIFLFSRTHSLRVSTVFLIWLYSLALQRKLNNNCLNFWYIFHLYSFCFTSRLILTNGYFIADILFIFPSVKRPVCLIVYPKCLLFVYFWFPYLTITSLLWTFVLVCITIWSVTTKSHKSDDIFPTEGANNHSNR